MHRWRPRCSWRSGRPPRRWRRPWRGWGTRRTRSAASCRGSSARLDQLNYSFADIGTVLDDVFAQSAAEAAGILQDVGALATDVASILQTTFGQSEAVIAGLLGDAGFLIADIEALGGTIGGALESAANEVADWFDSWW